MSALPIPTGFRLLVEMPVLQAKTKGGLYIPEDRKKMDEVAGIVAQVVAMGPDAYKDETRFPTGPWCQVGDFVMFRPYSGSRADVEGKEYRVINDDTVEAVVAGPDAVQRAS